MTSRDFQWLRRDLVQSHQEVAQASGADHQVLAAALGGVLSATATGATHLVPLRVKM